MDEIARRKQKWNDFQDMSSNVTRINLVFFDEGVPERPMLWWENADQRVDWAYEYYCRLMERTEWLKDDFMPYMNMLTGTEIFAEAFGCKVHKPSDSNPFALPYVTDASQISSIKIPRLEDTKLTLLFEMADKLKSRAGSSALLGLPDVQTPTDIAALIWEKTDFFAAMYDEPEAIMELTAKIKTFMFDFFDKWFARYGNEFVAHFPEYYMAKGITISEDEIGAVSDKMYQRFFKDELHEFSNRYGAIGIHCCADSKHQWKNLAKVPNLKMVNIIREPEELSESIKYFGPVCPQFPTNLTTPLEHIEGSETFHVVRSFYPKTKEEALRINDMINS